MGVRFPQVASTTFIGPLPATNAETVCFTTPLLNISLDFSQILIFWFFSYTPGTGNTTSRFNLRRGTTAAGTFIGAGQWIISTAAGAPTAASGFYSDTPGAVAGQQYSLTIQQNGATAAGVFSDGVIAAFAL